MSLDNLAVSTPRQRPLLVRAILGTLKWGAILVIAILFVTTIAARVLHARDTARWKAPGHLVDVGSGRRMHLYCIGSGTPTWCPIKRG